MGSFVPGGSTKVVAMQYKANDTEENLVALFDWIHGTDSSTIYGMAKNSILAEIAQHGGMCIPHQDGDKYIPQKALAVDGDWIIRHNHLSFTVVSDGIFKDLYYKAE